MPLNLSTPVQLLYNGIWYVDGAWVCPDADVSFQRQLAEANKRRSVLNYASLDEIDTQRNVLTPVEYAMLDCTRKRIIWYPQRFARLKQQYSENAGIMLMSRHKQKVAFCMCSVGGRRCGLWRVCPYCSHIKRMTILKKYLPAFHRGSWFFITLSWARSLWMESPLVEPINLYWGACDFALRHMLEAGYFKGAFVFEALHIESYVPEQKVLPHSHMVVLADDLKPETIQIFKALVKSYTGQKWNSKKKKWEQIQEPEPIEVEPSTRSYPIQAQADFANILNYLVVPLDFSEKYTEAWPTASAAGRAGVAYLNQSTIDFIDGWELLGSGRDGHYYRGAMHHSSGDFHGVKKSTRETRKHDEMVRTLLQNCSDENLMAFPFNDKTPIEHKAD